MPLFTIGIGAAYLISFCIFLIAFAAACATLTGFFGAWVPWTIIVLIGLYFVGKIIRIPGDVEYESRKDQRFK